MEINKISQPDKSTEKMVPDDSPKTESCISYCPDFSDIYDDSYEFWDFLHNKKERIENSNGDKERQETKFWDFLGSSSNRPQNSVFQIAEESFDSAITISNNSESSFKKETHLDSQNKTNLRKAISNGNDRQSPELKSTSSDDEFWDFLSCRSPVVTFKELLQNYNSINCDNESGIGSNFSRSDESPFVSISDYYDLERGSTVNSTQSSVSVNSKFGSRSENEINQNSERNDWNKLKKNVEPTDYTNYIDVLKYLQQECVVSDQEVNLPSIPEENAESEKHLKSVSTMSKVLETFNQNQSNVQEINHLSSNKSELNVSSASQKPVYDGLAPISSLHNYNELKNDGNSSTMYTFKLKTQETGKNHQLIYRRPVKRFKRNIQNRTITSNFNSVRNSNPSLTTSRLNSVNIVHYNQPNNQTFRQVFKVDQTSQAAKNSKNSRTNPLVIHPITTHTATPTIPTTVNNVSLSNSSTNSTPLYLLMSSNSETIQNPNYSHFFLVINNNNSNTQMNKPTVVQNSIATNVNTLKSTPNQLGEVLQSKSYSEVETKSDNVAKQNILIVNPVNKAETLSSASTSKLSSANMKYQTIPQVYLPYTSLVNSVDGVNQMSVQYLNKIPTINNTVKPPPVSVNNLASSSKIPNTVSHMTFSSVPATNFFSTVKLSEAPEQITNLKLDSKPKPMQSNHRQTLLKPIKSIPLGKDKYAIQQISTPVQICSTEDFSDSQGFNLNLDKINESSFLKNVNVENKAKPNFNIDVSEGMVTNFSKFEEALPTTSNKNILQQNESCSNSTNITTSLTSPFCSTSQNENSHDKNQTLTANSINVNVVPVSGHMEDVSAVSNIQMINTKDKQTTSCINSKAAGNLVPIKVGNTENKSMATLQELFPPPISMIPVCVLPRAQTQHTSQPSTSKVLILNGKDHIFTHKVKIDPIPNRERIIYKKSKEKPKKGRLKTVRELLQERRKSSHKSGKEIRVLRRVLRLSTCDVRPGTSSTTSTNIPKLDPTVDSNGTVPTRKRPNILVLPSSSKSIMKNSLTEEEKDNLIKEQETERFADTPVSENMEGTFNSGDSLSSCARSVSDRKDSRPRHYDMSQLHIGDFRVDDDIDSCGRFRSKFKVIFSKRLFYYDFPISRCNQYSLKSTSAWEQMARVAVPFKSVVSMSLNERTITININTPPTIAMGRFQARTAGIIPNSTMYDIAVESDCSWGCMIRSSFHHKIILRKKQASKLKSFLCYFDDRFLNIINIGLCESGVNSVDELSIFDGELSPTTLKQNVTKNKKNYIRRLSQWDSSDNEDQKTVDEDDMVLLNQMCSCRVSCRSIRCSCVKAAKSCNTVCNCTCCDNPLNILETLGMNLDFSLSDSCLFQNIYQIPKLIPFLTKEVKLTCCNTFARVQDCIPGTVLCPNVDCNVPLEFSWCKKIVCYPERNPRNHCSFCGQCCFSNGRHCMTCNRCYVVTSKYPYCPTCQEKTSIATPKDMASNDYNYDMKCHSDQKNTNKLVQKPEIVILDVYSLPKTSTDAENIDEPLCHKNSTDVSTNVTDCSSPTDSVIIVD